jgi:hypothetical protein
MAVHIPTTATSRVDGFIDDLINVFLDSAYNLARQPQTVPLTMYVTRRPHAGDDLEPIIRRAILFIPKLLAEGLPAECRIVLGWMLDTRRILISLPDNKHQAWTESIKCIVASAACTRNVLKKLVGQLNHAAHIILVARHFLSRVRHLMQTKTHGSKSRRP